MMDVPLIEIKDVSKTFNSVVRALKDVGITINKSEIVGVVGENGAGKTTLMKILAGVFPPDTGECYYKGNKISFPRNPKEAAQMGISIVYQEKGVVPALKVYQYLFLGHEDKYIRYTKLLVNKMQERAEKILREFHVDCHIDDYMSDLPLSTQKMIEIARAVLGLRLEHGEDVESVIILDEPTAPLTIEERKNLFDSILKMKQSISFVFVSHIMNEVLEFTDRMYVLRDGMLVAHHDLGKEEMTEEDLFRAIVGKESLEYEYIPKTTKQFANEGLVLSIKNLTKDGSFYDVSFELHRGECIGLFGPAGSGKKEVIKTIAGLQDFNNGILTVKEEKAGNKETIHSRFKKGIGYFSGETDKQLVFSWPIKKNTSIVNMHKIVKKYIPFINFSKEKEIAERIVQKFKIKPSGVNVDCRSLSGGNKQKVSVGKWFERCPEILLLEDPTIGIDVGAREDIYRAISEMKNSGVSMILVSDDPKEYSLLCDMVLFIGKGRVQKVLNNKEFKEAMEI